MVQGSWHLHDSKPAAIGADLRSLNIISQTVCDLLGRRRRIQIMSPMPTILHLIHHITYRDLMCFYINGDVLSTSRRSRPM